MFTTVFSSMNFKTLSTLHGIKAPLIHLALVFHYQFSTTCFIEHFWCNSSDSQPPKIYLHDKVCLSVYANKLTMFTSEH